MDKKVLIIPVSIASVTLLSGAFLLSDKTNADDVVDPVNITVPVSCTMSGTGMDTHDAEIENGRYVSDIGTTTLHAFCNDAEGFAIYANGYTSNTLGNNVLTNATLGSTFDIITGTATSAGAEDVSNWAMKLAVTQDSGDTTSTNAFVIDSDTEGSFGSYHTVPSEYTKVAHKASATDMTTSTGGAKLTTTYAAYISKNQPASTYSGQVKYVLVHPATANAPFVPHEMSCETETICYHTNADPTETEGTMENQSLHNKNIDWSSCYHTNYSTQCYNDQYQSIDIETLPKFDYYIADLTASNYSRSNYGFAGWNTAYDYSGTSYGPNETLTLSEDTVEEGLSLYAIWVPVAKDSSGSELTFQTSNLKTVTLEDGATLNDKANGYVTALRDIRDDDVYAIAKLADGQYWMIENLRLDNTANITTSNTQSNNGAWGGVFVGLADPEPLSDFIVYPILPNSLYNTTNITGDSQNYRYPRYNNNNTTRASGASPYGYGNYYTWAAAAADTTSYETAPYATTISTTSICPAGWRLPINDGNYSDYQTLHTAMGNSTYDSTASLNWRKPPNNFLYSNASKYAAYVSATIRNNSYIGSSSFIGWEIEPNHASSSSEGVSERSDTSVIRCIAQ